jgi:hypothetical protein
MLPSTRVNFILVKRKIDTMPSLMNSLGYPKAYSKDTKGYKHKDTARGSFWKRHEGLCKEEILDYANYYFKKAMKRLHPDTGHNSWFLELKAKEVSCSYTEVKKRMTRTVSGAGCSSA